MINPEEQSEPMGDDELAELLQAKVDSSSVLQGDTLSALRASHLSTYFRHGYAQDEIARDEDRSTTVDSTASDSVDWIMGQLLRTFTGGERVVSFIPVGPDDVEQAEQEVDVVDHIINVQNHGYEMMYSWLWDGLVTVVGYVKAHWEEKVCKDVETYTGLTADDLTAMIAEIEAEGGKVEILAQTENNESTTVELEEFQQSDELQQLASYADNVEQGEDGSVTISVIEIDVQLRITKVKRGIKVVPLPGDEVLVPHAWTSISLQDAPWCGHRSPERVSDLISLGFDEAQIRDLPDYDIEGHSQDRLVRHEGFDILEGDDDPSTGMKMVAEVYARVDRDGDGHDELIKAVMCDGQLLRYADGSVAVEEIEEIPLHSWTPFMIPHRHYGEGVVTRLADIQANRTAAERAVMDGLAFTGNPRIVVGTAGGANEHTVADALRYTPGGIIRADDANQVVPLKMPSTIGDTLPVLDYWDERKQERTGVTKYNQGLDSDHLNKTATGAAILHEAGLDKVEMIARNFAETGYRSLFMHVHALLRRHQDRGMTVQINGSFVDVDPRAWGDRSDVKVGVGLGSGSRDRRQASLEAVIAKQAELMSYEVPLTDQGKLFNALSDWSQGLGLQDPHRYFTDPSTIEQEAEPEEEEPTAEEALAQGQIEAARLGAVAKLEDVRAKAEASERDAEFKALQLRVQDDRERDLAMLRAVTELEKAGMAVEAGALRQHLKPDHLAEKST